MTPLTTGPYSRQNPYTIPASANSPKASLSVRGKTPPPSRSASGAIAEVIQLAELHSTEAGREIQQLREAAVEEMDQYLDYIGGPAGALALTGVAAASAFYLASRPTPQKPLVELHCQSRLLPNNARAHVAHPVADLYRRLCWELILHPRYSPGLRLYDYNLIPNMKEPLRGIPFRTDPEIVQAVDRSIRNTKETLLQGYDFHISGNELLTILVTILKDCTSFTQLSLLY
ncbi:hypothetical protein ANN_14588 [Periplaneta americana]|uniref:Uncharacterized protein n=1 Tax=Periplaneta americana TaxID=6978 RepID=A0ABQ8SWR5_PERAM|nr:hypothetical protein ANN_14588 [Periplaneta americana]